MNDTRRGFLKKLGGAAATAAVAPQAVTAKPTFSQKLYSRIVDRFDDLDMMDYPECPVYASGFKPMVTVRVSPYEQDVVDALAKDGITLPPPGDYPMDFDA